MPLRIAICDDSPADRAHAADLVRLWACARGFPLTLSLFPSAENFLFRLEDSQPWDILLLDIEMGPTSGLALAQRLRRAGDMVQIVFITGYSDYIAQGYDVAALHYLLKPVNQEKFFSVLDRAAAALARNEQCLSLPLSGQVVRVPLYTIRYVDVRSNYTTVHAKEEYTLKMPLKEIACQLDKGFYQAGRSLIVNLAFVAKVAKNQVILTGGVRLPLPRGCYEGLNRAIIQMDQRLL